LVTERVVAIVPVKGLSEVKGRLSSRLSPAERAHFALDSLDQVLAATAGSKAVSATLVVSPDARVRSRALAAGADAVDDNDANIGAARRTPNGSHNHALESARAVAIERWGPSALLVLAADLPLVLPEDVASLVTLGKADRSVVIAPDRRGIGTNALLLRPPEALPFRFGVESYRRHLDEAQARGLEVHVFQNPRISHDVDVPVDLEELKR